MTAASTNAAMAKDAVGGVAHMGESAAHFHAGPMPWRASALAKLLQCTDCMGEATVTSVDTLESAKPGSLCFARTAQTALAWLASPASTLLVTRASLPREDEFVFDRTQRCVLVVADTDLAVITLLQQLPSPAPRPLAGVDPSAVVHASAVVAATASIGPLCVVEAGAQVGERTVLQSQCVIGVGARVGEDCLLHAGAKVLATCVVGNRCQLHSGAVLGADGFGYRPHPQGKGLLKIPHVGNVVLGDDVEIGANTCIDRGKLGSTSVGSGTKIDNLVQIGHNCVIGRSCIICGNTGLAGSVTMGDGVVLGGSVNVRDNVTIGSKSQVAATSSIAGDVPAGQTYIGTPAQPFAQWNAGYKALLRLSKQGRAAFARKESESR